jgi:ABC-type transporter Mla maintaining outer membrane lipid asymmetry ATPase subunit MlaF
MAANCTQKPRLTKMAEPLLVLQGVGKCFRRGRRRWQVLADVSLTVAAGEVVGVVGGRGEGKTTLLEVAAGIQLPDVGTARFDGRDLARSSSEERAALLGDRIAWMTRESAVEFEVLDYVGLPLAMGRGLGMRAADDLAMAALERVGVPEVARRGWDELSNWEQVLVSFARGFACRPRLMLVDDLLDGLGPRGTREAGELLLSFAAELKCGVLIAASDLEAVLVAHRVLCFDGGSLAALSSVDENIVDLRGDRRAVSRERTQGA